MFRASNDSAAADGEPLLELPLSVLMPRRLSPDGPRRFGRPDAAPEDRSPSSERDADVNAGASKATTSTADAAGQEPAHLRIVMYYILASFAAQLALLIQAISVFRLPFRLFPFVSSLVLAAIPLRKAARHKLHPALSAAIAVVVILLFGLLNQETDSYVAAIASIAFYTAILSPLLWAGRLLLSERGLVSVLLLLWTFNAIGSCVGVLQVMYPGRFVPATSQLVQQQELESGIRMTINLANGEETTRPYGLTDQPGGAAAQGLIAFMFGLGLLATAKRPQMMIVYASGMAAGLFVIYLSQVRVTLITCAIAATGYTVLLLWRANFKVLSRVVLALMVIVVVSTSAAFAIGGQQVVDRMQSLFADNAGAVYYNNRGVFLDYTFSYVLPTWPVGAGLGRYGMMASYFGSSGHRSSASLYAEIQWTAWAYDGGWLMIIAYPVALAWALFITVRVAIAKDSESLSLWGALLLAYNVSAVAVTFGYCFFLSESGLEFWLVNALFFSIFQVQRQNRFRAVPVGFENVPQRWQPGVAIPPPLRPSSAPLSGDLPAGSSRSLDPTPFDQGRRKSLTRKTIRAIIDSPPPQASPDL